MTPPQRARLIDRCFMLGWLLVLVELAVLSIVCAAQASDQDRPDLVICALFALLLTFDLIGRVLKRLLP